MTFTTVAHSDPQLRLKHSSSIANLLAHRLEVAKASHNDQLVSLLEREYQQLMDRQAEQLQGNRRDTSLGAIATWWHGVWNHFADTIPGLYQLQVEESVDRQGQPVWQVYYPKTGQVFSTSSKTELQAWVQKNYWSV